MHSRSSDLPWSAWGARTGLSDLTGWGSLYHSQQGSPDHSCSVTWELVRQKCRLSVPTCTHWIKTCILTSFPPILMQDIIWKHGSCLHSSQPIRGQCQLNFSPPGTVQQWHCIEQDSCLFSCRSEAPLPIRIVGTSLECLTSPSCPPADCPPLYLSCLGAAWQLLKVVL